ncbi:MAG: hypothetical protein QOG27_1301 [Verrucomicrobiota bacterium]
MKNPGPRNIWLTTLIALLVVVAFNILVARFGPNLPPQQLLRRIQEGAPSAQTVFLGDSQMEDAADPVAFAKGCNQARTAFNAGLGGTYASEHCLILECLVPLAPSADSVVYGFFDTLLTEPVPAKWRDLVGNRALAYHFPGRTSALLAPGEALTAFRIQVSATVPMIRERMAIWAKVERARRRFSRVGLPPEETGRFGRARDFTALEPADANVFETGLRKAVEEKRPFNRSVQEIIRTATARGLKFYLIQMPVPAGHRERFYATPSWQYYQLHIRHLLEPAGGRFIDASDWIEDGKFRDPLHVTAAGAEAFSTRLAREICSDTDHNHSGVKRVDQPQ